MPSTGKVKALILPIEFSDHKVADCQEAYNSIPRLFFGAYDPNKKVCEQSLRAFYHYQSYGKLNITGDILDVYTAPEELYFYSDNLDNWSALVKEALDYNVAQGLDLNEYDSNKDNVLDCLIVEFALPTKFLWELGHQALGPQALGLDYVSNNVKVNFYVVEPMSTTTVTTIHEIGHLLGLKDNYIYRPPYSYCYIDKNLDEVMGSGDNYFNAYYKWLLGWIEPEILTCEGLTGDLEKEIDLYAVESLTNQPEDANRAVVLVPDPLLLPFTEFYIAEYRSGGMGENYWGEDFFSDSPGIVIWHCDTNLTGSRQYKNSMSYIVPVYKSGRIRDLDVKLNLYDDSDVYSTGDTFTSQTVPNSDFYDDIYTGAYLKVESITPEKAVIKAGFRDPDIVPIPELEIVQSHTAIRKGTSLEVAITAKCNGEIIPGSPDIMWDFVISHNNTPKIIANGTFNESFLRLTGMRRTSESFFLIIPGRAYSDSLTGDGIFRYIIPDGVISYHNMYSREVVSDIVYVDNTPPEIELQSSSPQIIECGESYTELGAVVTDNLDPDIKAGKLDGKLEIDASQVNTAKCGTYTVTYTATDHAGNETTVEREVIVQDTTAPTATVSYSTTQPTNGDVVAAITPSESVTVTNTENGSLSYTFTENGSFTFEFEDEAGNKGTAVATVSNIDKSLPTGTISYDITGPTNQDVTATLTVPTGTVILNNGGSNTHVFAENGSFEFEIQNAAGTKGTVAASVTWIDKEAPTATITYSPHKLTNQDVIAAITPSEEVTVTSDGGLSHTFPENGSFTYEFEDEAGNKGSAIATVDWIDKEPPVITLLGENPLTIKLGEVYEEPGAEVADNQDTEIQSKLEIDASELDTETAGTYTVRYSATDKAGNLTEITRTVKVEKPEEPTPPTPPNPPIFIPPDPPVVELPFTDVSESSWYYEAVKFMYEQGLMAGTGETTFSPNTATTRGMIAAILYRLEGNPETDASMSFTDIDPGEYYSEAIAWAAEQGIVAGYSETLFGPDDPVTREQLVSMLYRYAGSPKTTENLEAFTDSKKASKYAKPALCWAVETGILSGKGNGILDPQGKATRAEVASVLMRYCEKIG